MASVHRRLESRCFHAHKIGRLCKFKLPEVGEWGRAGGADADDDADNGGAK